MEVRVTANRQSNTASKEARDELFAKTMGKVDINFKTDYFKLDNFVDMCGKGTRFIFLFQRER